MSSEPDVVFVCSTAGYLEAVRLRPDEVHVDSPFLPLWTNADIHNVPAHEAVDMSEDTP